MTKIPKNKALRVENVSGLGTGDTLFDEEVNGFYMRVLESGSRKFYFKYKSPITGKERRISIGGYPDDYSLPQARSRAMELRQRVLAGRDPKDEADAEILAIKSQPTLADVCDAFTEQYHERYKSWEKTGYFIETYIKPQIGHYPIDKLNHLVVESFHRKMHDKPVAANRCVMILSKICTTAEKWELRPWNSNPCRFVEKFREHRRRRYMSGDEAANIAQLMGQYWPKYPQSVTFILLLIMTGARKSEIANARWSDLKGNYIELKEHKTDKSMDLRRIYIPDRMLKLLEQLPRVKGDDRIIGIKDPRSVWERIRKEAGCPDLRLHDLRHSYASAGVSANLSLNVIGELLGHKSSTTTKGYAHLVEDTGLNAAEETSQVIDSMMGGILDELAETDFTNRRG